MSSKTSASISRVLSADLAISVRGLGKHYNITHDDPKHTRLGEAAISWMKKPFRRSSHETFWALNDVSFDVKTGDVVGIIGRNGSGKSTLLKVLSRITEPSAGRVLMQGRVGSLLEVGTGFHPELTGRENIYLNGTILGMRRAEISRRFDQIVAFAEVERFLDTPVKRYSSGMYVRLAFAVAAHLNPEILIVDEVLAVGDGEFQKKCIGKMREVSRDEGRTILFVSHNLAVIQNLCNVVALLRDGRLDSMGKTQDILKRYLATTLTNNSYDLSASPRSGDRRVIFTGFHVETPEGNPVASVQCGYPVVLVFAYRCASGKSVSRVNVGFGLHPSTGERLSVLYSSDVGQEFGEIPPEGEFRCVLPRCDFAPNRLFVFPRIEVGGIESDFPRDGVGYFDIEASDYFGTGRMIGDRGSAPFLIKGDWSLSNEGF